jgi:hypothetical protein
MVLCENSWMSRDQISLSPLWLQVGIQVAIVTFLHLKNQGKGEESMGQG